MTNSTYAPLPPGFFGQLFEHAADPVFVLDIAGHFIAVNQAACDHTGYSRNELLTMRPEHLDETASPQQLTQLQKDGWATSATHLRKDGTRIPVDMHIKMVEHEDRWLTLIICRDVTERSLKEIEYQNIIQTTADGFWSASATDARILDVNEAYCQMVGYTREELLTMRIFDLEASEAPEETARHISRIIESGSDFFETQHRHKDGHLIEIEARVSYASIRGGMFYTFVRDISVRKRHEEELKLAASVFNASSASIVITDRDNKIVSVNPAFTTISGYEPEEVVGKNPNVLSSGKQSKEFYRDMWASLARYHYWQGELWNRRKDGQIYAEQLTINIISNKDGSVHRHVAIFSDITEKKQAEDLLWRQANYDSVTNLPNRRLFLDRLTQEIKKCRRATTSLALLFIDLDRFKEVNDRHGHSIGDQLLIESARRLNACVRGTDTVARLGGDEFTIILTNLTETTGVETVAKNINNALQEAFHFDGLKIHISGSVGIAHYPADATNPDDLTTKADIAMYASKRRGRNRICFYSDELEG